MNLCADGHDEICFEGNRCPCCELAKEHKAEVESLQNDLESVQKELDSLKDERDQLIQDIAAAMQVEEKGQNQSENSPGKAE